MRIVLYTTPTCQFCGVAKQFLQKHGVSFLECDLSQNPQKIEELVRRTGRASVPVIEVDGDFIVGFDKNRLAKKLGV